MFRVKVCGVTRPDDAATAVAAGADAIGLNFYERSPRYVGGEDAQAVAARCGSATVVGVFVNRAAAEIGRLVESTPLTAIQLHGDEPPELVADLPTGVPVVRAVRLGEGGLAPVAEWLASAERHGHPVSAVLVDAPAAPGQYGGSGHVADWSRVVAERARLGATPLVLAGGLRPENVAAAIRATRPDGVDVASGVEETPGVKSAERVERFVAEALAALRKVDG